MIKPTKTGKVRDIYELNFLALTTTDRVSAFDSILDGTVHDKGKVLQKISNNWMIMFSPIIKNHLVTSDPIVILGLGFDPNFVGRTVIVNKHIMLPVECIIRGYYIPTSHSWDQYKVDNTIQGISLPAGLEESEKLPEPIFTPTTKGTEDRPLKYDELEQHISNFLMHHISRTKLQDEESVTIAVKPVDTLAANIAAKLKEVSLDLYTRAAEYADKRGIILADTKLEFGIIIKDYDIENPDEIPEFELVLCDEAFTPDSSRYWDKETYEIGKTQPSMDKQFLRDYLRNELHWCGLKDGPVPHVPQEVFDELSQIYKNISAKLFG
ncbi:MAG: phosphoribosylaminoimidazolesuccinocarboxamide synthase [Clostridia bacterium]|nr:phosphoribosylaminoimidazolesuccinocarboxamide synthase [Clostridia bacterium]